MHQDITPPNVIDEAVEFVRDHFRLHRGLNIRQAHAHAAVSHFLGYNSKIALKSDTYFDPCDADLINYCKTGVEKLAEHIANLLLTDFGARWVRVSIAKIGVMRNVRRAGVIIERGERS